MLSSAGDVREIDKRVARWVLLGYLGFFPLVAAINAASILTDAARNDLPIDPRLPWLLELSSVAAFLPAAWLAVLLERRCPLLGGQRLRAVAAIVAGSVVCSGLHIAGMALLRSILVPLLIGADYTLLAYPLRDLFYEYRKDVFPYAVIIGMLTLLRSIEEGRMEQDQAQTRVRETGRLTLRSGAQTMLVDAKSVEWVRAAGNYVELRAAGRTYLPRTTLKALERPLRDAGVDVVRIHRSYIVNRAVIAEVVPTGEGDLRVTLTDGSEVRGSRRYRDQLGL